MGRTFQIPGYYRSPVISVLKNARRLSDSRKRERIPSILDLGKVRFKIARHFGFCFGVENAIEIAYRALEENPDKRVFLLSEMIHNPQVNNDLSTRGVKFLLATDGTELIPFSALKPDDIVIVPAFGTTVELFQKLREIGVDPQLYNATCPFVEKVWKRAEQLGSKGFTVIVHGKETHEETRATFSHARCSGPTLIIRDLREARLLSDYLRTDGDQTKFLTDFTGRFSDGFLMTKDLVRIGVVNQTTMLATETQEISEMLKQAMMDRYGSENIDRHFADTRDTLCYATYENQEAVNGLIESGGDIAIVVGGYNSSNTSHLFELCSSRVPTFHIKDVGEITSRDVIRHLDFDKHEVIDSHGWLPLNGEPTDILLTAGASCPDALVDQVLQRVASFFGVEDRVEAALKPFLDCIKEGDSELIRLERSF